MIEEGTLNKKYLIKVIHLIKRNLMFVVTNQSGHNPFMSLMKKIFKFNSLDSISKMLNNSR